MTRPVTRRVHRLLARLATLAMLGTLCWTAGFVWFLHVTRRPADAPPHVDGVVVLTGGGGRVELGLRLLGAGQADKLLLSGIGGGTDLAELGRLARIDVSALAASVTLGRYAASTRGNAVEAAAWAAQNRVRSIIVVTAAYHMPRALAELRQALPSVPLYPLPVGPLPSGPLPGGPSPAGSVPVEPATGGHAPADHGPSLRLQAEEYTKYLLVLVGLSPWFPHRLAMSHLIAARMVAGPSGDG